MAVAAVTGLMLGGAMKPNLGNDDRPAGPQMFAGWSGTRSTGPFDDGMTLANYNGQVPDYVLGTDWQKVAAWPQQDEQVAYEPPMEIAAVEPEAQPVVFTSSAFDEPPPEPVTYPSMSGGAVYGAQADTPPQATETPSEAPVAASLG
jgi:hypothetical protein